MKEATERIKRQKSGLNSLVRENLALGDHKRPWQDIATQAGVKLTTVYRRVAEQRARDIKLKRAEKMMNIGRVDVPKDPETMLPTASTPQKLLELASDSPVMSREERLQTLSWLAQNAPDAVKVQAIAKLEEFERAAGAQFGPPPPSTPEETVTMLCELFDGMDRNLIDEAINRVFDQEIPETPEAVAPDTSSSDLGGREA